MTQRQLSKAVLSSIFRALIFKVFLRSSSSQGQQNLCACSPSRFIWRLDFTLSCPPSKISQGSNTGISDSVCLIFMEDPTASTDYTPVRVTGIQVFELNQNLEAVKTRFRSNLNLVNRDTFQFTSGIEESPNDIPGGLQMRIRAENAGGDVIINDWIVAYTNSCSVEPFQSNGLDSLGYARFVSSHITHLNNL